MESQNRCSDTTDVNTQPTSAKRAKERKFKLLDLNRLIFRLEGREQAFDVETADDATFNAFAQTVEEFEDVKAWTLELLCTFVNQLWEFCAEHNFDFPLTLESEKINADEQEKLTNQA